MVSFAILKFWEQFAWRTFLGLAPLQKTPLNSSQLDSVDKQMLCVLCAEDVEGEGTTRLIAEGARSQPKYENYSQDPDYLSHFPNNFESVILFL